MIKENLTALCAKRADFSEEMIPVSEDVKCHFKVDNSPRVIRL